MIERSDVKHLKADLPRLAARGGALTASAQLIKTGLHLGAIVILARLLTPEDFGLVAMVTAVTALFQCLRDLGLPAATVQREDLTDQDLSTIFWINVAICIILTALVILAAPVIGRLYDDDRLVPIAVAMSMSFIFFGFAAQHLALLRRRMAFGSLAKVEVGAQALSTIAGLGMGIAGLGYWALVGMQLALPLSTALLAWVVCRWIPSRPSWNRDVAAMVSFGGFLAGFSILNYFSRNLDNVIIGLRAGAAELGHYSRAYSLLMLPVAQIVAPITGVATATLSRLQNEPARYARFYSRAVLTVAYLTMPLGALMFVLADHVILIIYGDQWRAAIPLFSVLAINAVLQPVVSTVGWLYLSTGRTDRMFKWACITAPIYVASFWVGSRWGAMGVAVAYTAAVVLLSYPSIAFAASTAPVSGTAIAGLAGRPLLFSTLAGTLSFSIDRHIAIDHVAVDVAIAAGGLGIVAGLLLALSSHYRQDLRQMLEIRTFIRRRAA